MRFRLFRDKYLFHFHTSRTDGDLSSEDYFAFARKSGVERLIFLEHIREKPSYDVDELASEIAALASSYGIEASLGFETKLMPDGRLDISEAHLRKADVIGIAEHKFAGDVVVFQEAFSSALNRYRRMLDQTVFVWVHPGLLLLKQGIRPAENSVHMAMLAQAQNAGVAIEQNLRYGLIAEQLCSKINSDMLVIGADAHRMSDLEAWQDATRSSWRVSDHESVHN